MSEQQTVPCPTCNGDAGSYEESSRPATDHKGDPVTIYSSVWRPCTGPCAGSGQITGGRS
jgi:hypothetical protein